MVRRNRRLKVGGAAITVGLLLFVVATATGHSASTRTASARAAAGCGSFPGTRDPSNPLMLSTPPGANPINGASFFVDGPAHGMAAGAIAELLGINPKRYPDDYSWARFEADLDSGRLHSRIAGSPALAHKVMELEKIASQPEAQRFAAGQHGGTPAGIEAQVTKTFCNNLTADPGTIPIITTYFAHPDGGGCGTAGSLRAATPRFKSQIDAVARGTGNHPAVFLLELDAIGSSKCIQRHGGLSVWESWLRYEVAEISALPHTVVYLEAGYSDGNSPSYTAKVLNASGVSKIRGFFTNDTHNNWTSNEIKWGEKISQKSHGADFIIDTAQNGNGPKLSPHPSAQGSEELCNPPDRALGPQDTTSTGFPHIDAFLWTHVPAVSDGSCNGGTKGGSFFTAQAIEMAAHANGKLGPGYPSRPY
jgi:endoglucanase